MMDIESLAEAIRNLAPTVPLNRAIWSPDDVADYLRVARRTVAEKYANDPKFPRPIRLNVTGNRGMLRWKASEIMAWVEDSKR
jgi:predicted DNA-binding transcriptional regulator AlpA